jgi:hypothetical protein
MMLAILFSLGGFDMLTIFGRPHRGGGFCDGVSRRDFLTIGGTIVGSALSLPNLLAAEAGSGISSHRAIINVFLPGGPPHLDMWDLKPDAPAEIRGEFKPIDTKVPGIRICEHFPQIAKMADRFVFIRSLVGSSGDHAAYQCMTGRRPEPQRAGYWPSMGAWVSKIQGPANRSIPPHLSLMYRTGERRWGDPGDGGFLGLAHAPFRLVGGRENNMQADSLALKEMTLERLQDRVGLMKAFDSLERSIDNRGVFDGMDSFSQQAVGILTSSRMKEAMDLSKEKPETLARYGVDDPAFERDGAPRMVRNFCLARRLVEAGARVVSMNFSRWDWHGSDGMNFVQGRKDMPLLDRAVSALVSDLHERGLERDVVVVVWGEFGRTPRINKQASRDHWPQLSCALLAGGGLRTGQVIGESNRNAEYATKRPVTHQEIFATLYTSIGIKLAQTRVFDPNGRPQYLVDPEVEPLRELI